MPGISLSTARLSRDTLKNSLARCVSSSTIAEANLRSLQERHAEAVARLEELQEELEKIELYHMGHRLMQRAGQAAIESGQVEGPGLFEQYESAKETQKVLHDARACLYMAPRIVPGSTTARHRYA